MPESKSHRVAKGKAAGKAGETEIPLASGQRLDAGTRQRATEVERSGSTDRLKKAAQRLKASVKPQKVLQVPQHDMTKATKALRDVGVSAIVKNMSGAKRRHVRTKK